MPIRHLLGAALVAASLIAAVPARAEGDPDFLMIGAGATGVIADREQGGIFHFEYRSDYEIWKIRPFVGAYATTDASLYAYFGLGLDIFLGNRVVLTPSTAVGAYEQGDGEDLGHIIEFRSGVELAYRFDDRSRLGIGLHHLSNAGLGDRNPGIENLILTYSMPVGRLFSKDSQKP